MRKFFLCLLAVLLISGTAYAVSMPQVEYSKEGPGVWLVPVYNNDSTDLAAGDVVVWDIGSSTGDDDNYVVDTTTANTVIVAGVIWPKTIAVGDSGTMAIRGAIKCDVITVGTTPGISHIYVEGGSMLCTSGTAGEAHACPWGSEGLSFGYAINAADGATTECMVTVAQ